MPPRLTQLAALCAALLALAPANALAQGAGDEQYQDPFAQEDTPAQTDPPPAEQPPSDPAPPAQPVAPADTAVDATTAQEGSGQTLPRTGFPALLVAALGWPLLVGGAALRRVL